MHDIAPHTPDARHPIAFQTSGMPGRNKRKQDSQPKLPESDMTGGPEAEMHRASHRRH